MRRNWKRRKPPFRIKWNPSHEPTSGTKLSELRIKSGPWEFGIDFRDVTVAHEWGKTPSEFWALSRQDRTVMIAWTEAKNEMTAYEIHQKVIRKAAELLEQEKEIIETAFNDGYRNSLYDLDKLGSEYYFENFGDVS